MTLDYFYGQVGELFSFYRIPKALFLESRFQNLSTDAKTLYGILLDRMSLSAKNGWLDEQGRVFIIFTIEDVKRALCCADNKATKLLRELEEFGLIERKRRGLGRPSLVYVKNFSAESSKSIFQNRDFHDSGGFKNASQDPAKSRCNKTEENSTEKSETYPFYSEEDDGMSKHEQLEEYFSQSLELDILLRLCPDDEDTIYQIVDLLVDTCATNRKMLRIAGDDKPAEVVRSRFMKLNADHIQFVLKCLAENSSPIRNMKQYLLASLYNAPTTMQLVYQNRTNHDFAHKIGSVEEMQERVDAATARYHELGDSIKAAETRMAEIAVLRTHIVNYARTRPIHDAYRKAGYSKKFLGAHREEITLHKAAKAAFDEAGLKKLPKTKDLSIEYAELLKKKKEAYPDYRKARDEMQELMKAQKNVEMFFAEEKSTTEKEQAR